MCGRQLLIITSEYAEKMEFCSAVMVQSRIMIVVHVSKCIFKPPAVCKAGIIVFYRSKSLYVFLFFMVQNEDSTDRAEIFTEASHYALTPSKLRAT